MKQKQGETMKSNKELWILQANVYNIAKRGDTYPPTPLTHIKASDMKISEKNYKFVMETACGKELVEPYNRPYQNDFKRTALNSFCKNCWEDNELYIEAESKIGEEE